MKVLWNHFNWNSQNLNWNGDVPNPKKSMLQIVLNLRGLSDNDIESKLRALAKAQTDHPTAAPGLTITSAALTAAADDIKNKLAAQATTAAAAQAATTDKDHSVEAAVALLRDYGPDVLQKSGKDAAKITLLGLTVRDTAIAVPAPTPAEQVPTLALSYGLNPGTLNAKCSALPRVHSIEFQVNTTPNAAPTWQHWTSVTATPVTLTGLPSGALVQVRARGIFADGPGAWSDIAETRVP